MTTPFRQSPPSAGHLLSPQGRLPRKRLVLPLLVATVLAFAGCGDDSSSTEGEGGDAITPAPSGAPSGGTSAGTTGTPPRGTLPEQSDEEMVACLEDAGMALDEDGEEALISGAGGDVAVLKTFPNLGAARTFTSQLSVDYVAAGPRVALIQGGASDEDVGALGGCIGL